MIKLVKNSVAIILLFVVYSLNAQWNLDQISGAEGLSQNTVKSVIKDSKGFIWIGTYYGVNKYDGYTMTHYNFLNNDEGLSSNLIHNLFEDKDGFIWVGTSDAGINRIDPSTGAVKKYFNTKETSGYFRNLKQIYQIDSGTFFFYQRNIIRFFKVDLEGNMIFQENVSEINGIKYIFTEVVKAKDGSFWMYAQEGGTSKLYSTRITDENGKIEFQMTPIELPTERPGEGTDGFVRAIYEYPENTVWLVNNRLELRKIVFNEAFEIEETKLISLLPSAINDLSITFGVINAKVDGSNRLWVTAGKYVINYNLETGEIVYLNDSKNYELNYKDILQLLIDDSNILWLGTKYNGLFKMDLESNTFLNSGDFVGVSQLQNKRFHQYPIVTMAEDNSGNIWFGSQESGGIALLKSEVIEKSIHNNSIKAWAFNYLSTSGSIKRAEINNIRRLFVDSKGVVWVAAASGLYNIVQVGSSKKYELNAVNNIKSSKGLSISTPIFSINEDSKENLWLGYWNDGLVKLTYNDTLKDYTSTNYRYQENSTNSLSNDFVRDILEDTNNNLWVGTIGGLNRLEVLSNGEEQFVQYLYKENNKNSLSNNHVTDVFQAKNNKIYVGTFGGGLNEISYDENNEVQFKHYTEVEGLPSNVVYQISEDDEGNLWLMHVREISKLNTSTGDITFFEIEDGFNISEFKDNALLKTKSGAFLFGGVNGFTFLKPERLSENKTVPNVEITDFKMFEQSIKPNEKIGNTIILEKSIMETKKIELPHDLNSFEFIFSSLNFSNPEKNQYKYILENFNETWQDSRGNTRRFASYTNVPPGSYTFKVLGSNSAGVWAKSPKEIEIVIHAPWYLTPVAIFIFSLIILIVVIAFVIIKLNQIRLEGQIELDSAVHEKTDELNKMKLQFFTNISHELRTPLTLIIGPLQQIMQGKTDVDYVKKLNAIMYKNSVRLLKLINQLLDFRKAESGNLKLLVQEGDIVAFINEVYSVFEEIAQEKDIKFVFVTEIKSMNAWFDRDKLEKILYNLLSNAFKFTPRGKSIKINFATVIEDNIEMAQIKVIDYGVGIPEGELESIFERFYQTKKEDDSIHIGSGLGLAYTKRLAEIHHGSMKIDSVLHVGTTCIFQFPAAMDEYQEESIVDAQLNQFDFKFTKKEVLDIKESEVAKRTSDEVKVHSEETPTILIVEDNAELRNYLANFFSETYVVITAENGVEGLEMAMDHSPNLIISDLMMPKMDGIEMCKRVKSDIKTSHIPVIILTAKAGFENEKEGLETGADEFVLKPFNTEILKLRVENILRTKQLWISKYQGSTNTKSFKKLSNKLDQEFLDKCAKIIKANMDNPDFSVEHFTSEVAMSRSTLFKKIKSITGQSTSEFIRGIRLKRAVKYLKSGQHSITEVIFMVGFSDPKYFRTCFKKQFNKTPSEFLKDYKET